MAPEDDPSTPPPVPPPTRPRWRGGRPRLSEESRRGAALPRVRVTAEELAEVRGQAEALGLPIGALVRRAVLGYRGRASPGVPAINREAYGRLSRLASNLNQYVKAIHQGQAAGAPLELLEQLLAEVRALQNSLKGEP